MKQRGSGKLMVSGFARIVGKVWSGVKCVTYLLRSARTGMEMWITVRNVSVWNVLKCGTRKRKAGADVNLRRPEP
jgi:hypothetical protein